MPFWVAPPFFPIFWGSSQMTMGRFAAMTSMGLRLPNSSRSSKMMRAALFLAPSFIDALNACMLMTMQLTSLDWEYESSSVRLSESYMKNLILLWYWEKKCSWVFSRLLATPSRMATDGTTTMNLHQPYRRLSSSIVLV